LTKPLFGAIGYFTINNKSLIPDKNKTHIMWDGKQRVLIRDGRAAKGKAFGMLGFFILNERRAVTLRV
jgi:hypothetical protein